MRDIERKAREIVVELLGEKFWEKLPWQPYIAKHLDRSINEVFSNNPVVEREVLDRFRAKMKKEKRRK